MTAVDNELVARIEETIREKQRQSLDAMRAVLNETGIRRSRAAMSDAPGVFAAALTKLVEAKQAVKNARAALDDETDVAEAMVARPFETEGNKTWLVDDEGARLRTVVADEQKSIVASLIRRRPEVVAARKRLDEAERAVALAEVDVDVAKAHLSIAKHDVDAAAAELQLAAAIKKEETR